MTAQRCPWLGCQAFLQPLRVLGLDDQGLPFQGHAFRTKLTDSCTAQNAVAHG